MGPRLLLRLLRHGRCTSISRCCRVYSRIPGRLSCMERDWFSLTAMYGDESDKAFLKSWHAKCEWTEHCGG